MQMQNKHVDCDLALIQAMRSCLCFVLDSPTFVESKQELISVLVVIESLSLDLCTAD